MVWVCHKVLKICQNNPAMKEKKRGIQGRRWEDYITEWTEKALSDNMRRAEGRERERCLELVSDTMMLLRSPGPRDMT